MDDSRGAIVAGSTQPQRALTERAGRVLAIIAWAGVASLTAAAVLALTMDPWRHRLGLTGAALSVLLAALMARLIPMMITSRGRQRVRRRVARLRHHEYWNAWVFYAPLVLTMWPWVHRRGGFFRVLMAPTAVNPGIDGAGGFVGESKSQIMAGLAAGLRGTGLEATVLTTILIEPGEAEARTADLAVRMQNAGLAFPVILKPDSGQRGFGVRLIRDLASARAYLAEVRTGVIVQPFHPGPHECGICWVRSLSPRADGLAGTIFSITRKDFPVIEGDGHRTLEELVWAHPRFFKQAPMFMRRHAERRGWVPGAGERVPLALSGNHCQGTLFRDGADLITPELERVIDGICRNFRGRGIEHSLDYGRLDLRYLDDEQLRAGEGFAILELNGALGESTNMYDPAGSPLWAYRILRRQWECLFELGMQRRDAGFPTITMRELMTQIFRHFRERSGSELAD